MGKMQQQLLWDQITILNIPIYVVSWKNNQNVRNVGEKL